MTSRTGEQTGRTSARMVATLVGVATLATFGAAVGSQTPNPNLRLTVVAQIQPTTCYVGQGVALVVGVAGERERPTVSPPRIDGADVELLRTEQVPLSVSGIGDSVWEKNLFRSIFLVVPRRPGVVVVPAVSARLGERTGRSDPIRLNARPLPQAGRPATFLGGVGAFEVEAAAEPSSVRLGQSFTYRLTVRGPGARGLTGPPSLGRFASIPLGLRIERLPDIQNDRPFSRTFVFQVRPTRSGAAILPPVAIAGFDPATERYETRVTSGIPIRVVEPPTFDPSLLAYGPTVGSTDPGMSERTAIAYLVVAGVLGIAASVFGVVWVRTRGRRRANRGRARWLGEAEAALARAGDPAEVGRVLTDALAGFLERTSDRPPGALTPIEAAAWIARATSDPSLGPRAARLVERCDRARFRGAEDDAAESLRQEGRALLRSLADSARVARVVLDP